MKYLQAVLQQGRAEEARKVHTLEVGGSIPSPVIANHGLNDTQSCQADWINNF